MTDSFPELAKVAVHVVAPVVGFKGKSVHDEIAVPPTENVTVPETAPDTELTVAVSDTGVPLATEDVGPLREVVVDVGVGDGAEDVDEDCCVSTKLSVLIEVSV